MTKEDKNHHSPDKPEKQSPPEVRYVPIEYLQGMQNDDEDEIDLLELVKTIWDGRMLIVKTVIIFIAIGLFVAFTSTEEYESQVRLLPETQQQSSLGGLGSLARQFGVNAGSQQISEGIPPDLYPDITQSNVFLRELLDYRITLEESNENVTLMEYFSKHQKASALSTISRYTIQLPFTVLGLIRNSGEEEITAVDRELAGSEKMQRLVRMSREEWRTLRILRERISVSVGRDTGVVTVTVKMQNGDIAADVADEVVVRLSSYITDYRTEKARRDVEFIELRYEEARERFEEAQRDLARFNDENRGQLTALARTEEQRLQSQYNLTFNLYNTMAERLEEARIKLQEETPVVNVLEPAAVPDRRSEPKRGLLLVIFTLLGGIFGTGLIFGINLWNTVKEKDIFT
jgi:uncharacterized protein involved in exopolysaccharide biosynthesis